MKILVLIFLPFFLACNFNNSESSTNKNLAAMQESSTLTKEKDMTTYYFIRHAEKQTSDPNEKDPGLTEQGIRRSENWAQVFKDVQFDMIYSSDYKRTRSTAKIIADSQEKEIDLYDANKLNDSEFQEKTRGKKVLVVGHSNTNPAFVNYILDTEEYSDIPEMESGSLFIVHVHPDSTKTSELLYIN